MRTGFLSRLGISGLATLSGYPDSSHQRGAGVRAKRPPAGRSGPQPREGRPAGSRGPGWVKPDTERPPAAARSSPGERVERGGRPSGTGGRRSTVGVYPDDPLKLRGRSLGIVVPRRTEEDHTGQSDQPTRARVGHPCRSAGCDEVRSEGPAAGGRTELVAGPTRGHPQRSSVCLRSGSCPGRVRERADSRGPRAADRARGRSLPLLLARQGARAGRGATGSWQSCRRGRGRTARPRAVLCRCRGGRPAGQD